MKLCRTRASIFLGNVFLSLLCLSECLRSTVHPDMDSVVSVHSLAEPCVVCTASGPNDTQRTCHSSLSLVPGREVSLVFNCSLPPEQSYVVQILRSIVCTKDSCNPASGLVQASLLTQLPRNLTWTLEAPKKVVMMVDILRDGLDGGASPRSCPDGFLYSISQRRFDGTVQTRSYCRGGSETHFERLSNVALSLQVQPTLEVPVPVFTVSTKPLKGRTVLVTFDPEETMLISRGADSPECEVCTNEGSSCSPTHVSLSKAQNTSVEFGCPQPQDVFTVQLLKKIACTERSCTPAEGVVQPDSLADFQRSLSWDITLPKRTVLTLEFPAVGLTETTAEAKCQDGYKYSFHTTNSEGEVKSTTYCKKGPVTKLSFLGTTSLAVDVPKGGEMDASAFSATAVPRKGRATYVTPDPDTRIIISRESKEPDCEACVEEAAAAPSKRCNARDLMLKDARNTSVDFSCPLPQEVFRVEINKEIDCSEGSCSVSKVHAEASIFPDFNRTFTWDLKVPSTRTFQMDFPKPGMRQIRSGETCPDGHTYTIVTYLRTGPATIGTYCKSGAVSRIQVRYKGRLSLDVPGDRILERPDLKLSVGPETDSTLLAIVKVDLPRGVSETEFTTPGYPDDFPDYQQIRWDFTVPGMHNYTMRFGEYTLPECLSEEVRLEYRGAAKKVTRPALTGPQPEHRQGSFNMSLWNCETNQTLQGLTLDFKVSVMRSGHPVLCSVDLGQKEQLSLQVERVGSDPNCEIRIDSIVKDKITVATGAKASLSFLDCTNEDLRLTASKTIACHDPGSCAAAACLLTVPGLDPCLPVPLHSFTWHLRVPEQGTVDLASPTAGGLRQSLPGQECNGSVSMQLTEADGSPITELCHGGVLPRVQVHANISVTVAMQDFTRTRGPFLNVSISDEISEHIIYTVRPQASSPALLATPGWPGGMRASSTVSWIVLMPSGYRAALEFANVSQPKCGQRHTSIKVQRMGSKEETLSRREDEEAVAELEVSESFYLNMSNCLPEKGHFGALAKVTLQPKSSLVAIVLGVMGALLVILAVLVAVCLVVRNKKRGKMLSEASIYMGKGSIFRPGDRHFAKARSDNTSHIYDSIDESMVYGHLLQGPAYAGDPPDRFNGMPVESYRTFLGPVNGAESPAVKELEPDDRAAFLDPASSFLPPRPRTPIDRQDSLGFQDRRMVDNVLYTFKSTGDINTIRLSGADQEAWPVEEEVL